MSLDPVWLRETIELVSGRAPAPAYAEDLAEVLSVREEVLPWLMLRQDALAAEPAVRRAIEVLAESRSGPATRRPAGLVDSTQALAAGRKLEDALRQTIAENIAGAELAGEVNALMGEAARISPSSAGDAYLRRFR